MIDSLYRFLSRLGFTDPLHPEIVHIPIGLVIGAFVFLVIAMIFKRQQLVITARHASILALVFVFPSILFGVLDWIHFFHAKLNPTIEIKIALAAVLIVLLSVGIAIGGKGKSRNGIMIAIYSLSLVAVVALGYFGASLIGYSARLAAVSPSTVSSNAASPKAAASAPSSDAGKAVFEASCAACHPGGANSVYPKLPIKGSKRLASFATFEAFVRSPTMPDGKGGDMPPFGADQLTAAQVKDLYAYASSAFK